MVRTQAYAVSSTNLSNTLRETRRKIWVGLLPTFSIALAAHAATFSLKVSVLFGGELARSYVRQDLQRSSHRHSRNEDDPALFTRRKIGLSDNDRRYVYTMLLDARPSHDISNHRRCAALLTRCDCLHDVLVLGSTLLMLTPCFSHVLHCSNLVERVAH